MITPRTWCAPLPNQTPACRGLVRSAGSGQARSRLGRGCGWGSELVREMRSLTPTPTPPAFAALRRIADASHRRSSQLRTAAEGRLCFPTRGRVGPSSPLAVIPVRLNTLETCGAVRRSCLVRAAKPPRLDLELRSLDPVPEVGARRLLQIGRVHGLERAERHEIVFVVVRRETLYERLLGDVILAPGAPAAETFHRQAGHCVDHVILARPA